MTSSVYSSSKAQQKRQESVILPKPLPTVFQKTATASDFNSAQNKNIPTNSHQIFAEVSQPSNASQSQSQTNIFTKLQKSCNNSLFTFSRQPSSQNCFQKQMSVVSLNYNLPQPRKIDQKNPENRSIHKMCKIERYHENQIWEKVALRYRKSQLQYAFDIIKIIFYCNPKENIVFSTKQLNQSKISICRPLSNMAQSQQTQIFALFQMVFYIQSRLKLSLLAQAFDKICKLQRNKNSEHNISSKGIPPVRIGHGSQVEVVRVRGHHSNHTDVNPLTYRFNENEQRFHRRSKCSPLRRDVEYLNQNVKKTKQLEEHSDTLKRSESNDNDYGDTNDEKSKHTDESQGYVCFRRTESKSLDNNQEECEYGNRNDTKTNEISISIQNEKSRSSKLSIFAKRKLIQSALSQVQGSSNFLKLDSEYHDGVENSCKNYDDGGCCHLDHKEEEEACRTFKADNNQCIVATASLAQPHYQQTSRNKSLSGATMKSSTSNCGSISFRSLSNQYKAAGLSSIIQNMVKLNPSDTIRSAQDLNSNVQTSEQIKEINSNSSNQSVLQPKNQSKKQKKTWRAVSSDENKQDRSYSHTNEQPHQQHQRHDIAEHLQEEEHSENTLSESSSLNVSNIGISNGVCAAINADTVLNIPSGECLQQPYQLYDHEQQENQLQKPNQNERDENVKQKKFSKIDRIVGQTPLIVQPYLHQRKNEHKKYAKQRQNKTKKKQQNQQNRQKSHWEKDQKPKQSRQLQQQQQQQSKTQNQSHRKLKKKNQVVSEIDNDSPANYNQNNSHQHHAEKDKSKFRINPNPHSHNRHFQKILCCIHYHYCCGYCVRKQGPQCHLSSIHCNKGREDLPVQPLSNFQAPTASTKQFSHIHDRAQPSVVSNNYNIKIQKSAKEPRMHCEHLPIQQQSNASYHLDSLNSYQKQDHFKNNSIQQLSSLSNCVKSHPKVFFRFSSPVENMKDSVKRNISSDEVSKVSPSGASGVCDNCVSGNDNQLNQYCQSNIPIKKYSDGNYNCNSISINKINQNNTKQLHQQNSAVRHLLTVPAEKSKFAPQSSLRTLPSCSIEISSTADSYGLIKLQNKKNKQIKQRRHYHQQQQDEPQPQKRKKTMVKSCSSQLKQDLKQKLENPQHTPSSSSYIQENDNPNNNSSDFRLIALCNNPQQTKEVKHSHNPVVQSSFNKSPSKRQFNHRIDKTAHCHQPQLRSRQKIHVTSASINKGKQLKKVKSSPFTVFASKNNNQANKKSSQQLKLQQ